jgi:CCR4-NOT transcriptional regulation complex NOT5 subunit
MLKRRVEVLFDEAEFKRLETLARAKGRSIGALIRSAVARDYLDPDEERRREAVKWLASQTFEGIGGDWEQVKAEMEEERYRQIVKSLETD